MDTQAHRLLELICKYAYREGNFELSSGQQSTFYVDGKQVSVRPEGAYLIGELLFEKLQDVEFDAIGGLASGAVPLVTSFVHSAYHHGRSVEGFFVRPERKGHGTRRKVEGVLPENARVVIVDDVVTSGKSVMEAIDAVKEQGAEIVRVVSIVDREQGANALFSGEGYIYESVFSISELKHVPA